jgi:hypothetical protein
MQATAADTELLHEKTTNSSTHPATIPTQLCRPPRRAACKPDRQ